jgi:hypothetical protein
MKRNLIAAVIATGLFVALAMPVRLAAQDSQVHKNDHRHHHYKLIGVATTANADPGVPVG